MKNYRARDKGAGAREQGEEQGRGRKGRRGGERERAEMGGT